MAAYCLPRKNAAVFLAALKDGTIDPAKLMDMSSGERREFFKGIIGEENAAEVNALFESKLLLQDQQRGLVTWAKQVAGISEPVRKDLLDKIKKLDRVLQPSDEKTFLADLAAKKLGVSVTADEAKEIFDLSRKVENAKAAMQASPGDKELGIQYGLAYQDMTERLDALKPKPKLLSWNTVADVLNIPRSLLTLGHGSAPFVQSWGLISTKQWLQGYPAMLKYFSSEENFRRFNAEIIAHPDYDLAMQSGLSLTKLGAKLSEREEAIQSTLVERANEYLKEKFGVPNLARASSRGFTGYLNFVRWRTFTDMLSAARLAGEDVQAGSQITKDLATTVNNFSGRGSLGALEGKVAPELLNSIFFAPRKIAGTVQMFNPINALNPAISPTARKMHMRLLAGSLIATAAMLGVARMMGAEVSADPRHAEFGKIKVGGTRFDVTGGNDIYLRLLGRLATNQEITSSNKFIQLGQGYKPTTRADLVETFLRGKLAPVASTIADALYGTDPVGRPFSVTQEMRDKLIPITISSWINFFENDPRNTAAYLPALSALVGVGVEPPFEGGRKFDVWGRPRAESHPEDASDPVTQALDRVGVDPSYPPRRVRGVKLPDNIYDPFSQDAGQEARKSVSRLMNQPNFSSMPLGQQEEFLKKAISKGHDVAATRLMHKFPAIFKEGTQLKQVRQRQGTAAAKALGEQFTQGLETEGAQ